MKLYAVFLKRGGGGEGNCLTQYLPLTMAALLPIFFLFSQTGPYAITGLPTFTRCFLMNRPNAVCNINIGSFKPASTVVNRDSFAERP